MDDELDEWDDEKIKALMNVFLRKRMIKSNWSFPVMVSSNLNFSLTYFSYLLQ